MRKDKKLHDDHTEKRRILDERLAKIDSDVERQEKEIAWLKKIFTSKGLVKTFVIKKKNSLLY